MTMADGRTQHGQMLIRMDQRPLLDAWVIDKAPPLNQPWREGEKGRGWEAGPAFAWITYPKGTEGKI